MNLAELQEVNKKLPKASKNEIAAALNRLGVNPDSIKVGDKLKFPAEINEFNGTITKGVVNGNTFFQVAVEVNGTARNVSINSLFRSFNDRENSLNPYYTGSYSIRVIIIITSFSTENNRKHKRVTLKKEKKFSF